MCNFLFGVFRPTREFFTHIETSPLPVNGCKFWPMLGTYGHWAVRVLQCSAPTVTREIRLEWSSLRTCDTHTRCRAFGNGAVTTRFYDIGLSRLGWTYIMYACYHMLISVEQALRNFCLFEVFRSTREFFTHRDVTIAVEGRLTLTFARHSWPLST